MPKKNPSKAGWNDTLTALELGLGALGAPAPLRAAKGVLDMIIRHWTQDGKVHTEYERNEALAIVEEAIEPLAGAALENMDGVEDLKKGQDQIIGLLCRVLSELDPKAVPTETSHTVWSIEDPDSHAAYLVKSAEQYLIKFLPRNDGALVASFRASVSRTGELCVQIEDAILRADGGRVCLVRSPGVGIIIKLYDFYWQSLRWRINAEFTDSGEHWSRMNNYCWILSEGYFPSFVEVFVTAKSADRHLETHFWLKVVPEGGI